MKIFDWNQFWDVAGPFVIMAIAALVIFVFCMIVMSRIPKGMAKELFRILAICLIVGGSVLALYIAAGIWGYR
jgi:hypothetical protein